MACLLHPELLEAMTVELDLVLFELGLIWLNGGQLEVAMKDGIKMV